MLSSLLSRSLTRRLWLARTARKATADGVSMAERLPGPDETPAVEEHDPIALDRQAHSSAAAGLGQCLHYRPDRLRAGGIIHDVHPFVEFAVLVPGCPIELLEARACNAGVELRGRHHADMGWIAQSLDGVLQARLARVLR